MYLKNIRTFACIIALSSLTGVFAAPLTPQQSIERALKSKFAKAPKLTDRNISLKLAHTSFTNPSADDSEAALYIFSSDNGGYIITSADDLFPPVLGFSDDSNFDPDNIPDNMKWWLEQYSSQIEWATKSASTSDSNVQTMSIAGHPAVSPLVTTQWNQRAPYNNLCPGGSVTGCVATAMAQVINYHKWPATTGTGTYSYQWNSRTLSFDYGSTVFDWGNMLNTDNGTSDSSASQKAVATLMYACGVGVNMNYSTSESGASSVRCVTALIDHFGYDCGISYLKRDYFSEEEWDEMIYNEISNRRPVLYGGQSTTGGHEFVCDGYRSDGYYHINWGWGGLSDGYFLLSALTPNAQGTGGSNGGYNYSQDAICGIQRPVAGSTLFLPIYANGGFAYSDTYAGFWFGESKGYFAYYTNPLTVTVGVKVVAEDGTVTYVPQTEKAEFNGWSADNRFNGYSVIRVSMPATLAPGSYKVYPAVKGDDSDWSPIYVPTSENQYVTMRVGSNGVITYNGSDPDQMTSQLSATKVSWDGDNISGSTSNILVTFKNSGTTDYSKSIYFKFIDKKTGHTERSVYSWTISVKAGESITYKFGVPINVANGDYILRVCDYQDIYINEPVDFYVGIKPTSVSLSETSLSLSENEKSTLLATVKPDDATDKTVIWESSDNNVATVSDSGEVTAVSIGQSTVTARTFNGIEGTCAVTVTSSSSIEDIIDNKPAYFEVYNLQGVLLRRSDTLSGATESLPKGLYIVNGKKIAVK